jgi:hypothetical protein
MMRRAILTAAMACALTALPVAAQAKRPYVHFHDSVHLSETGQECGIPVTYETDLRVHLLVKEAHGSDGQAFLGSENVRVRTVVTNPANHRWFVISRVGASKEVKATHVGGDLWAFKYQESGVLFKVTDSQGRLVMMDRGRFALLAVFDTLGDGQPGGIKLSEEIVAMNGQFPTFDEEAVCAVITELIG